MKVVHVSTVDSGNGAAIAAYRIHASLLRLGHDSTMFVADRRRDDPTVVAFEPPASFLNRVHRRVRAARIDRDAARYPRLRVPGLEFFSDDRSRHGPDMIAQLPDADIVNVHAMFDFVDYRDFLGDVPRRVPVVRTMHDMSFFTGGCHVAAGCRRFIAHCGACPRLESATDRDLSREIWTRKRTALGSAPPDRLHLVAPSRWLAAEARQSSLAGPLPLTIIPYGVDTEVFRPRDQQSARDAFSIPRHARVVLFVANPIDRVNKGFGSLVQALDGLRGSPTVALISAGSGAPPVTPSIPYLHLGHLRDEEQLTLAYSAADVVALPSADDNLPLTGLEALACGKPIVAFAVGGIPDFARAGVTGMLAAPRDVKGLGQAIEAMLADQQQLQKMAESCRRIAVEEYSLRRQAERYVALYESILSRSFRSDGSSLVAAGAAGT